MEFDLNGARPVLLIVDVQALFASPEGPFENTKAEPTINNVNKLSSTCRQLGIPVIFSNYVIENDLSDVGLLKDHPVIQEGHLCKNGSLIGLDDRLEVVSSDIHLTRNRPSAFWGGELGKVLSNLNADTILVCGLGLNNAISATVRDSFARDIQILVAKECTGPAPWETHLDIYFEILHQWTAEVTLLDDLIERLSKN